MAVLDLVSRHDPLIRTKLEDFDFANPPMNPVQLYNDLGETMIKHKGLGLAANQVGLPYRVFVMTGTPVIGCFNPRIVDKSSEMIELDEGCLTFPGVIAKIKRPRLIKVRYTEPNGNVVTKIYTDMTARIIQHEIDHLDGKVFLDYLSHVKRESVLKKAAKLKV